MTKASSLDNRILYSSVWQQASTPLPEQFVKRDVYSCHRRYPPGVATACLLTLLSSLAASDSTAAAGWSLVPHLGVSVLADQSAISSAIGGEDSSLDIAVDTGFTGGLGLRYDYDSRWNSEFGWEYRSNNSDTSTAQGETPTGGNYASNIFYLNGRYNLIASDGPWAPFIGAGLTYIEEIDIDVGRGDTERSFSDSGTIGFQLIAGVNRDLTERLYLNSEIRYSRHSDLQMSEQTAGGRITDLDYDPVTLQLGLGLRF